MQLTGRINSSLQKIIHYYQIENLDTQLVDKSTKYWIKAPVNKVLEVQCEEAKADHSLKIKKSRKYMAMNQILI